MYCWNCGKEIDDKAVFCVHCGVATEQKKEEEKVNTFGISGFIVSLVSLFLGLFFGIASAAGLALSIVGVVQMKTRTRCAGLAVAGFVVGIISTAIWGTMWRIVFPITGTSII